jgi:hypothetical protein
LMTSPRTAPPPTCRGSIEMLIASCAPRGTILVGCGSRPA